jgi:hypothetical protein
VLSPGGNMPKLAIVLAATVALLFAGLIAWNARSDDQWRGRHRRQGLFPDRQ